MGRTYGYFLTISIKDLIASIMVNDDKTEITKGELYDLYLNTMAEMKKRGVAGRVAYSRDDLKEFKYDNEKQFDVGISYIKLRDGYSVDWLQENVISYMSIDTMQLLGLVPYDNEFLR